MIIRLISVNPRAESDIINKSVQKENEFYHPVNPAEVGSAVCIALKPTFCGLSDVKISKIPFLLLTKMWILINIYQKGGFNYAIYFK